MSTIPGWAVAAAILLNHEDGLSIQELTDRVIETRLSGLGKNATAVEPYKILWSQLLYNNPHADWFESPRRNWVTVVSPKFVIGDEKVQKALKELAALQATVPPLAEEFEADDPLWEGAATTISVNAYERNPKARMICIEYYGPQCSVCGLDFAERYGEVARNFIHVHHLRPLSTVGEDHEIDPINDLRPICPNCHAIIHLNGECRTIDEVKRLLREASK